MSNIHVNNTSILRKKPCWMGNGVADTRQSEPLSQVCAWRGSATPRTGDAAVTSPLTIWGEGTFHTTKPFVAQVLAATGKPSTPTWGRQSRSNTALTGQPDPAGTARERHASRGERLRCGKESQQLENCLEGSVFQRGNASSLLRVCSFLFVPCTSLKTWIFSLFQGFLCTDASLILPSL